MAFSIEQIKMRYRRLGVVGKLITINVIVFLVAGIVDVCGMLFGFSTFWLRTLLSLPSQPQLIVTHFWTVATYMFTHYSFLHILFNMLWLWWFGEILLNTLSDRHLVWLYVLGGIGGAILFLLFSNLVPSLAGSLCYLNGASAGVLCIMTVAAFRSPDHEINLFIIGSVKLKWIAIVCIALAFIGLGGGNAGGESAHIGGVLMGCAYSLSLRRGYDWLSALQMKKPARKKVKISTSKIASKVENYRNDVSRLDELLDKIRISGFASLSSAEKRELTTLSEKMNRKKS